MPTELSPIEVRARIYAALGDPARLAIADALVLGDASPGDVAVDLDMSTNLLAHHRPCAAGVSEAPTRGAGVDDVALVGELSPSTLVDAWLNHCDPLRPRSPRSPVT